MNVHSNNDFTAFDQVPAITGYTLALNHAPAHARAFAAARLVLGQVQLVEPRLSQSARLARVSGLYTAAAVQVLQSGDTKLVRAVLDGRRALLEAAALAKHPRQNLVEAFLAADASERADLGRIAGVDVVFDTMISPVL